MDNVSLYNHLRDYSVQEVFNNAQVGYTFEFFSTKEAEFIVEELSNTTAKSVALTNDPRMIPTWTAPVLLREYAGKNSRYSFKLSPQDYLSTGPMLNGVLEWIKNTSKTDRTTGMTVSLSFNNRELQTAQTISNMDVAKMVLKMDENYIWKKFPERRDSPFSMSVKHLIPMNEFLNISNPFRNINNSFAMPMAAYYGIDFTDQTYGILKFNYIGGKGYEAKAKEINEALNYFIISTYQVLNVPGYSAVMEAEMAKIIEGYSTIRRAYYDPEFFLKEYKDIQIGVDLKTGDQIIKTYWEKIRGPLTKVMLESGFKKGKFNLDTEQGLFQIKDAKLSGIKVSNLQIVNSEVQGIVEKCALWKCTVKNSQIRNSTIIEGNKIADCYLLRSRADRGNEIHTSTIFNSGEIINCKVFESVVQNAGIGKEAKLDEHCLVVNPRENKPEKNDAIAVKEIRDYNWLKNLIPNKKDKGYANEFKIKW
jgi:hypothetical protein